MNTVIEIAGAVVNGRIKEIRHLTERALGEGLAPKEILDRGLMCGMEEVGAQFKKGKKFVPEVMLAARTMQASLDVLRPLLVQAGVKMMGRAVIGTVKGDLHDIGKNLVGMMLEGSGFEVIDLGRDVPPERFVTAVVEHQPDLVGMSALLTTTMRGMGETIARLKAAGVRDGVKIMVGGAPVTAEFARQIGADGYAASAPAAAELAKQLLGAH